MQGHKRLRIRCAQPCVKIVTGKEIEFAGYRIDLEFFMRPVETPPVKAVVAGCAQVRRSFVPHLDVSDVVVVPYRYEA